MYKYSFFTLFLFFSQFGFSQTIWPGDVNNNGIVNKVDLLYIGYAYGNTGASRAVQGSGWSANVIPQLWENNFPNGLNYLYADCNGDGIINETDANIVINNLGLVHDDVVFMPDEVPEGIQGIDPPCRFVNPPNSIPVDQIFNLEIALGNQDFLIDSMSGFTFIINADPPIIGVDDTELAIKSNTWMDKDESSALLVQQQDFDEAKLKVAYTKKDQNFLSGGGAMAQVSFLIENDVIDLLISDTVIFTIDSILVLNNELEAIPVVSDTLKLVIDRDRNIMVSTSEYEKLPEIELYPNPSHGLFLLESSEPILKSVEVMNRLGQKVHTQKLDKVLFQTIDIQHLQSGIYWIKFNTKKRNKNKSNS